MIPRLASSAALPATGVVTVVRGTPAGRTAAVPDTLAAAGGRLEVTLNTPGALEERARNLPTAVAEARSAR